MRPVAHHAERLIGRNTLLHKGFTPSRNDCAEPVASLCHSDVITPGGRSCLRSVHEVDYALEVVDRPELHHDLALAFAKADRHPGIKGR